jgi:hypothetical protein
MRLFRRVLTSYSRYYTRPPLPRLHTDLIFGQIDIDELFEHPLWHTILEILEHQLTSHNSSGAVVTQVSYFLLFLIIPLILFPEFTCARQVDPPVPSWRRPTGRCDLSCSQISLETILSSTKEFIPPSPSLSSSPFPLHLYLEILGN